MLAHVATVEETHHAAQAAGATVSEKQGKDNEERNECA